MKRLLIIIFWAGCMVVGGMLGERCGPARCSNLYNTSDTVKVAFSRMDTLFNGTDEVVSELLKVFRWKGVALDSVGLCTEVAMSDSGAAGFYWVIPDSTYEGQYCLSWSGTIQGRTPASVYNFEVEGPPSGPNKVNLWVLASSDSSGISGVSLRIKDEDLVATLAIGETNASGLYVWAAPADTYQVILSNLGFHTFTIPEEIIVTSSGLTDSLYGTAFNAGSPDSSNVTRIYGWLRALDGSNSEDVEVKVTTLGVYDDIGHPGTSPTIIVMQQAVMDTTNTSGYFAIDLLCADELLPQGGSTGNVRHVFEFSKDVRVGPFWITDDDTLFIPCTNQSYLYWDSALRP
jgi:hypothetical protein